MSTYGEDSTSPDGRYCEHFDCFPDIFSIARDGCILILNVIPEITQHDLSAYPYLFNPKQLARRRSFYHTTHPWQLDLEEMMKVYRNKAAASGFDVEWYFFQKRTHVYYAVLKLSRTDADNHS